MDIANATTNARPVNSWRADREKRWASYRAWIDAARVKAAKHAGRSGFEGETEEEEEG